MSSIRRRLTVRFLIGTMLLASTAGGSLYVYLRDELAEQYDLAAAAKARSLAALSRRADDAMDLRLLGEAMTEFAVAGPETEYAQLWWDDGRVAARTLSLGAGDLPRRPTSVSRRSGFDLPLPDGRAGRAVEVRFQPRSAVGGPAGPGDPYVSLVFAFDRAEFSETLRDMLVTLLVAGGVLGVGTVPLAALVVRSGLRPLQAVADAAARVDASTLDVRFPTGGLPEELVPICQRLNDLLGRLEEAFRRERRFASAVAHELRTPVAELRALAEVAIRWPGDAASAVRNSRDALAIAEQMGSTIQALLALLRSESGRQPVAVERIEADEVLREAWAPYAAAAEERGLAVTFMPADGTHLTTDPVIFASMLRNVFSNAVSYTPPGGRVSCAVEAESGVVRIRVENSCAGLGPEDLPRLREPFWRKDAARTDATHSGLGLALVDAFARVLGIGFEAALPARDVLLVTFTVSVADRTASVVPGGPAVTVLGGQ